MSAKAEIYGLRTHDNRLSIWFEVLPEGVRAYAFPGKDSLHIVFGGRNVGDADGDLWGRLMNFETGLPIIPKKKRWCAVGDYVWWEKTFDMPTHSLRLSAEVGSNEGIDERHIFTVYAGEPPFDYTWYWKGKGSKVTVRWEEDMVGNVTKGAPPPSDDELVTTARSIYRSAVSSAFAEECYKQGLIVANVTTIAGAWVERGDVVKVRAVPLWIPRFSCRQDITVYIEGKVTFGCNEDLDVGSPIAPIIVLAIIAVVGIALVALALQAPEILKVFFKDVKEEESHFEQRNRWQVGEEGFTAVADITLPDGTVIPAGQYFPPGTVIEWTTIEDIKKKEEEPALGGIAVVGVLLLAALFLAPRAVREVRRRD